MRPHSKISICRGLLAFVPALLALFVFSACSATKSYPSATIESFMAECRDGMWRPKSQIPEQEFCKCVLSACQKEWDAEKLNRILVRSRTGGWGTGFFGIGGGRVQYPAALTKMMAHCETDAQARDAK